MTDVRVQRSARREVATDATAVPAGERRFRPVLLWAGFGVFFLVLQIYIYAGWITSGEARRTPVGPTPVPTWMKVAIHSWEVGSVVASLAILYWFLIRPWRRERRITLDGILCLTAFTIFWQDSIINMFQVMVVYNSEFFNLGSWYQHVPGWIAPRTNLISTALIGFAPGGYLYFWFGMMVVGCWVMRKAKERRPTLGPVGLILTCFAFFVVADFIAELTWMRLGFYAYVGGVDWLTVFRGHYYQFPIYVNLIGGVWYCAFTCLRYFKNDRGETWAEWGLHRVNVKPKTKTVVRFLAMVGACNVIWILVCLPVALSSLYQSPWPRDITQRSYFMDGICGTGTPYACPGDAIPIPRPDSAHIGPDGQLVVPRGVHLPKTQPFRTE